MQTLTVFSVWVRYEFTMAFRYVWDTVAEVVTGLVVFGMLALGASAFRENSAHSDATVPRLLVGFMLKDPPVFSI